MQHFCRKIIAREKERPSNFFAKIQRLKIERKFCLLKKNHVSFQKMQRVSSAGWLVCVQFFVKKCCKNLRVALEKIFAKILKIRKKIS